VPTSGWACEGWMSGPIGANAGMAIAASEEEKLGSPEGEPGVGEAKVEAPEKTLDASEEEGE
jgi:hypothetical protein